MVTEAGPGAAGLAALRFLLAPICPLLVALTPERVGRRHLQQAMGLQVAAAYLGTAALPGAGGVLAARAGLEVIPAFVVAGTVALALLHEIPARAARRAAGQAGRLTA